MRNPRRPRNGGKLTRFRGHSLLRCPPNRSTPRALVLALLAYRASAWVLTATPQGEGTSAPTWIAVRHLAMRDLTFRFLGGAHQAVGAGSVRALTVMVFLLGRS
jgi:hypothetical protein